MASLERVFGSPDDSDGTRVDDGIEMVWHGPGIQMFR
jgi:hypothetical protein